MVKTLLLLYEVDEISEEKEEVELAVEVECISCCSCCNLRRSIGLLSLNLADSWNDEVLPYLGGYEDGRNTGDVRDCEGWSRIGGRLDSER